MIRRLRSGSVDLDRLARIWEIERKNYVATSDVILFSYVADVAHEFPTRDSRYSAETNENGAERRDVDEAKRTRRLLIHVRVRYATALRS